VAGQVQLRPVPAWCQRKGNVMGKEARSALLLLASAALIAVMVEWVVGELTSEPTPAS
jgi:hypothetical protein